MTGEYVSNHVLSKSEQGSILLQAKMAVSKVRAQHDIIVSCSSKMMRERESYSQAPPDDGGEGRATGEHLQWT